MAQTEPIVLKSSAPISTKMGWTKWAYIISLITIPVGGIGIFFLLIILFVEHLCRNFHKDKMRKMKFKFINEIPTSDEIYNTIQPAFIKKYGDKVEFDRVEDSVSIKYDGIYYDINLQGDGTFCVWWRKSFADAFFTLNEWKEYRKIRTGTALVAYEVQQAFNVH